MPQDRTDRRTFLLRLGAAGVASLLAACTTAPSASAPTAAGTAAAPAAPATTPVATAAASNGDAALYGVSTPLTGNNAEFGQTWQKAFALALDDINGSGGIKGRKVDLLYEDTQADPKQSVPVAQKFVADTRVLAELGDFASVASIAASPIYLRARMVQFGFTNSAPAFTKSGEFMFSTILTNDQEEAFLAQTAFDKFGKKHAIIFLNNDTFKIGRDAYAGKITELGGLVVASESYLDTDRDFRPALLKVRDAQPDVVCLLSFYTNGAQIVQQGRDIGLSAQFVANGGNYSPQFIKLGGDAAEGVVMSTNFFPGDPRPDVQAFVKRFRDRNAADPDQFAAFAYDALKIITWATERGGFDREGIQKALVAGTDIPSVVYGPFKFNEDRRVANAKAVTIQVKGGQFAGFA